MYLIRFLDYLDNWKKENKFRKLPLVVKNDCISKDGDLSFFRITNFDNATYDTKEILNAVCRYAFNNFKKWEDVNKENGAVFLPRKKVDRIKKVDEDPPGPLSTIHCNMSQVLSKESNKLEKLIFQYRKSSYHYKLHSMESVILSLSKDDWESLFQLVKLGDRITVASKIRKEFFRGKTHIPPKELLEFIDRGTRCK